VSTVTAVETPLATVPCWDIKVNLTPPEVVASRQLRSLRRIAVLAILGLVVAAVLVYGGALYFHSRAAAQLARANATTASLEASRATYSDVTAINTSIAGVRGQVAGLMKSDVDIAGLLAPIRAALSGDMSLSALQLSIQPIGAAASGATGNASLDTSGQQPIATVTASGQAKDFNDVSEFTGRLKKVKGLVDINPANNTSSASGFQFSVTFTVTQERLSHRYSTGRSGSK
jgi:hypothetical protein